MKTLIFILLFAFCASVNAQWYYNSFGVTNINELNKDQLDLALQKSMKTIHVGKAMTFIGVGATIIGGIVYASGLKKIVTDDYGNIDANANKAMGGAAIMSVGGLVAGIGIPVWISGATRKSDIEIALVKFKPVASLGIGINFRF